MLSLTGLRIVFFEVRMKYTLHLNTVTTGTKSFIFRLRRRSNYTSLHTLRHNRHCCSWQFLFDLRNIYMYDMIYWTCMRKKVFSAWCWEVIFSLILKLITLFLYAPREHREKLDLSGEKIIITLIIGKWKLILNNNILFVYHFMVSVSRKIRSLILKTC